MSITAIDEKSRSRPHRRVERILDKMRINYESEYDEFVPYALDVWLPEWWCAIEIDGPTHSKAKNAKRDAILAERYGVLVLHLPTDGISPQQVEIQVLAFIRACGPTAAERRRIWRS